VESVAGVRPGLLVTVRTPATSANLGPGFDSLGLALALYDEVEVEATAATEGTGVAEGITEVVVEGEGAGAVPQDGRHLVLRAIRAGLAHAGAGRPVLRLRCRNAIPHGRGLGSSASAVVAGLVAARGLLIDPTPLDDATLLRLATAFEGHPDNAAAALLGGFTISWTESGPGHLDGDPVRLPVAGNLGASDVGAGDPPRVRAVRVPVHPDVRVVACVPDRELSTSVARLMLPAEVPHADAAFNAGRAALLVEALARRPDLLPMATADRLHQGQRASAMPDSARLVRALRGVGAAAVVSGAGPTVLVLGEGERVRQVVAEVLGEGTGEGWPSWRALSLETDTQGVRLITQRTDVG
jgi:homoserine kinase